MERVEDEDDDEGTRVVKLGPPAGGIAQNFMPRVVTVPESDPIEGHYRSRHVITPRAARHVSPEPRAARGARDYEAA